MKNQSRVSHSLRAAPNFVLASASFGSSWHHHHHASVLPGQWLQSVSFSLKNCWNVWGNNWNSSSIWGENQSYVIYPEVMYIINFCNSSFIYLSMATWLLIRQFPMANLRWQSKIPPVFAENRSTKIFGGLDLVSRSFTDYLIPSVHLNELLANRPISPNTEIK